MSAVAAPVAASVAAPVAKKPVNKSKGANKKKAKKAKKSTFVVDLSTPLTDGVLDSAAFEKFFVEHIKVGGKVGNLADQVSVHLNKDKLAVTAKTAISKRYIKYLAKKFLKKKNLKDYMRLVATSKKTYTLKYYDVNAGGAADEE